jgi:hypothetical protein
MEVAMKAGTRIGIAFAVVLSIAAIAAIPAGAGAAPTAQVGKASTCTLSTHEQRHLGASYVQTPLKVEGISCDKAKSLVKDYHACRHSNGGADGTCNSVDGYSCNEKVLDQGPYQFTAKATCRKGDSKVKQTFIENT